MRPFRENRSIGDVNDFNEDASAILEQFCSSLLLDDNMTYDDQDDDGHDCRCYRKKAINLVERLIDRLHKVGVAHFPQDAQYIEIATELFQEAE